MEILTSIPTKVPTTSHWQSEMKAALRDIGSLLSFVGLDLNAQDYKQIPKDFPVFVPRTFASRIRRNDPADPILRQLICPANQHALASDSGHEASARNGIDVLNWKKDPVDDKSFEEVPGLLHKYPGRVLILLTGACAIHCRYCFRQNFDYSSAQGLTTAALEYLKNDSSISEVILSGGDPLIRSDDFLAKMLDELAEIPHLKRVRIHTRTPVVIPSRITPDLAAILQRSRLAISVVLHVNHAQEIDDSVRDMITVLRSSGLLILNQSVLLRGVNANSDSLFELCSELINNGVVPYYLHLLDPVEGAEGYLVSEKEGVRLIHELRAHLPGYAVPRLAREIIGKQSKTIIA